MIIVWFPAKVIDIYNRAIALEWKQRYYNLSNLSFFVYMQNFMLLLTSTVRSYLTKDPN